MERNRACVSGSNGVNARRHKNRTNTLRENPDVDGGFELQESARLRRERVKRDRERKRERRRDFRERQGRSKRRRGGGDDTSDESFNEEEDEDDEDEDEENPSTTTAAAARLFPPLSGSVSHRHIQRRRSFPLGSSSSSSSSKAAGASPVWKPGDEIISSSIPRKPRSASTKRSRDWISSRGNTLSGGVAEQILRQGSSSPARQSGVVSPPSSSNSFFKKKLKHAGDNTVPKLKPPKASPSLSKQNSSIPEKLEMEIAEVLFGLMTQSQGPSSKKDDSRSNSGPNVSHVTDSNPHRTVAPKRKRPIQVVENPGRVSGADPVDNDQAPTSEVLSPDLEKVFLGEDGFVSVGDSVISHVQEETIVKVNMDDERESGVVKNQGNFCNDSPSMATVSSTSVVCDTMIKANSMVPEVEIHKELKIDLMAPPRLDVVCGLLADESEESKMKMEIDNGARKIGLRFDLETPEIIENILQQHQEIPIMVAPLHGIVSSMEGGTNVTPSPIQLLPSSFTQPRPKRCATHCYIARNVHCLQQLAKMNPVWQADAGPATLSQSKACNLNIVPSGPVGNVDPNASYLDSAQRKQHGPPVGPSNIMGPTIMFPLNHQQVVAAAVSARPSSPKPPSTTGGNSSSNPSLSTRASATAMSFNYPPMAAVNEPQYLAILQNQGYPFPMPSGAPPPNYWGPPPGQAMPFFNGSFYPSQMIHPSQIQHHQTPSAQRQPNLSASSGPLGQQPSKPESKGKPGCALTQKPQQLFKSNARPRHLESMPGREGSPTTTVDSGRGSCPPVKSIYAPDITMPVHPHQPQQFAMSFGNINGSNSTYVSSSHQNLAIFQSLPEATRQNIQMISAAASQASQSNNNNFRISESGKPGGVQASNVTGSSGKALNASLGAAIRSSQPNMNPNAHHGQGQLQQQQMALNRSKMPATINGTVFPHALTNSPQINSTSMAQSPRWKNYSRTLVSQAPSSLASSTLTSLKNSHSRPPTQTHNQISFGGNSKPSTNSQGQEPPSPSNSSVSKGSSRTTSSTSTNTKAGQSSIISAQQLKILHSSPSQKSPSILGNQQQHMFFSNPYPQAQSPHSNSAGSTTSGPNGFYMQPIQARPNPHHQTSPLPSSPGLFSFTSTNDPATGHVKDGRLVSQGIMHTSQFGGPLGGTLLPAGFSYVQLKPAEQK